MANFSIVDPQGSVSGERADLLKKIQRVNEEAKLHWRDPKWRADMAQEMTETIYWGFQHEQIVSLMSTVENLPFDGRATVSEVRGLRAFWTARGGYIETSQINKDTAEIPRDTIGFHVYDFEDKIETNFAESQSNLVNLGTQRLDAEVNLRLLRLFQAAIPSMSPYYVSGALTLAAVNTALRAVRDSSLVDQVVIIGRATMTEKVIDLILGATANGAGFLPATNEDLIRRGVLGTYRGAQIVTLKNYRDDGDVAFFPGNELYVVGADASKSAFFGGAKSNEWTDPELDRWHFKFRKDFGAVVHRPERARRLVDGTVSAT